MCSPAALLASLGLFVISLPVYGRIEQSEAEKPTIQLTGVFEVLADGRISMVSGSKPTKETTTQILAARDETAKKGFRTIGIAYSYGLGKDRTVAGLRWVRPTGGEPINGTSVISDTGQYRTSEVVLFAVSPRVESIDLLVDWNDKIGPVIWQLGFRDGKPTSAIPKNYLKFEFNQGKEGALLTLKGPSLNPFGTDYDLVATQVGGKTVSCDPNGSDVGKLGYRLTAPTVSLDQLKFVQLHASKSIPLELKRVKIKVQPSKKPSAPKNDS